MTTTVRLTIRTPKGVTALASLVSLLPDGTLGKPLASHSCSADNTEEVCEFTVYEGVALVVCETLPPVVQVAAPTPPAAPVLPDPPAAQTSQGSETPATSAPLSTPADAPAPAPAPTAPVTAKSAASAPKSDKRKAK